MGAERWDEQVGSVADEAARLLESLRRSAAEAQAAAGASAGTDGGPATSVDRCGRPDERHGIRVDRGRRPPDLPATVPAPRVSAAHDPFCAWCPLCRGAAVVRSLSPETLTRLADLAAVAASVLTDLAGARSTAGPRATRTRPAHGRPPGPPPRADPIPVRDADDPQEAPRG